VDGELDVVTLKHCRRGLEIHHRVGAISAHALRVRGSLGRGIVSAGASRASMRRRAPERDLYVSALVNALKAHILRGSSTAGCADIPTAGFSAYRLHHILNVVSQHPEVTYTLDEMAADAGSRLPIFAVFFAGPPVNHPITYVMKDETRSRAADAGPVADATVEHRRVPGIHESEPFHAAFRQHAGKTPTEYRRQHSGSSR